LSNLYGIQDYILFFFVTRTAITIFLTLNLHGRFLFHSKCYNSNDFSLFREQYYD